MLPADPAIPPPEIWVPPPGINSPGNSNIGNGSPVAKPRTITASDWSSGSQSEWEILSQASSSSRSIIKTVADFDENDPDWYPGAVKIPAGSQVRSIKNNFKHDIYSQCKIGNTNIYIPKRLLQPFVQTNPIDS